MEWLFFIAAIAPSLLLMVSAVFYWAYPPKSINLFYGYRTRKSMRNQDTWDFANRIGAKMMFYVAASTLMIAVATYFIAPHWAFGISIFFLIVAVFIGIFWCERQLDLKFDKDGKPLTY